MIKRKLVTRAVKVAARLKSAFRYKVFFLWDDIVCLSSGADLLPESCCLGVVKVRGINMGHNPSSLVIMPSQAYPNASPVITERCAG